MLTDEKLAEIADYLKWLPERKSWQHRHRGNIVKVVRRYAYAYEIYHNGHLVHTDADWMAAYDLVKDLLVSK